MEINEGNKLIAEFMGAPYDRNFWYQNNQMYYHIRWSWLMPVVEKIETLTAFDGRGEVNYIVSIEDTQCIISQGGEGETEYEQADTKIEATWKAVTQFIQWYNTTLTTK